MKLNKSLFLLCCIFILGAAACNKSGKMKNSDDPLKADVLEQNADSMSTANEMAPTEPLEIQNQDSLFMSYERTACFGRCPIFKIKMYNSGYVTYEGINFVDYMGYYQSRIDPSRLEKIKLKLQEVDYMNWADSYDNENLMDLPARIFKVNMEGTSKRVVARYQIPEEVTQFSLFIENEFKDTQWVPVTHHH